MDFPKIVKKSMVIVHITILKSSTEIFQCSGHGVGIVDENLKNTGSDFISIKCYDNTFAIDYITFNMKLNNTVSKTINIDDINYFVPEVSALSGNNTYRVNINAIGILLE